MALADALCKMMEGGGEEWEVGDAVAAAEKVVRYRPRHT